MGNRQVVQLLRNKRLLPDGRLVGSEFESMDGPESERYDEGNSFEQESRQGGSNGSSKGPFWSGRGAGETEHHHAMPHELKAGLEQLSGLDLSEVRVHYNSSRPSRVSALAYTQGADIHVAPGQEKHLAHEGWHVVQQMRRRLKPTLEERGLSINDDPSLEREADAMGMKASQISREAPVVSGQSAAHQISCYETNSSAGERQTIQRFLDPNSVRFQRVPNWRSGILLLRNYDRRALELTRQLHAVGGLSLELRTNLDILQANQSRYGPAAVETMEAASRAITRRITRGGRAGRRLQNAIDEYCQGMPLARGKVQRVLASQHRLAAATNRLHAVVLEAERMQLRRDEAAAEGEVRVIEQRQERARGISDAIVDGAIDVLSGDWKGPLEQLGRYVAREVVGTLVEDTFESELTAARTKLEQIQTHITEVEDAASLRRINAARQDLRAATADFRAETEELPSLARRAQLAHERLYRELSASGVAGRRAADVIDQRIAVGETAQQATAQVTRYARSLRELREPAQRLGVDYAGYAEIVRANPQGRDPAVIDAIVLRATHNREAAELIVQWVDAELGHLPNVTQYLTGGEYSQSFEEGIEDVLHRSSVEAIEER